MTTREQFTAVLASGPLLRGDAIALLSGDGESRISTAIELLAQRAAPALVVSGGLDRPPYSLHADAIRERLVAKGVNPACIRVEGESQHTAEQARALIAMASEAGWRRLLLVTSPYHMPRAFLSFLHVLLETQQEEVIHLVAVPTSHTPWFGAPDGLTATRFDLLTDEAEKVERYAEHVATYQQGIDYLRHWEGR